MDHTAPFDRARAARAWTLTLVAAVALGLGRMALLPESPGASSLALAADATLTAAPASGAQRSASLPTSAPRWWKGNTHTHTLNSDGDSSPGEVSHWYRDHGYDFLVLSDHNYHTVIDELEREFDVETARQEASKRRRFLLIPGEEVTDRFEKAEIHINALNSLRLIGPHGGASKGEVLQRNIDAIAAAGGTPSVNHPNFVWSLTADDLAALRGLHHFEVYNGHPGVHNFGGGGTPSLEDLWDDLLSRGLRLFAVAVDDAHDFKAWGPRESNPGRGWIHVRSPELSRDAIQKAFAAGDF